MDEFTAKYKELNPEAHEVIATDDCRHPETYLVRTYFDALKLKTSLTAAAFEVEIHPL